MSGLQMISRVILCNALFKVQAEEFPYFRRCVQVLVGPGVLSSNNFIEPYLVSAFAVDESVCNHFVAAQREDLRLFVCASVCSG